MNFRLLLFPLHRNELLRVRNKEQVQDVAIEQKRSLPNVQASSPISAVHSQLESIEDGRQEPNYNKLEENFRLKGLQHQEVLSSKSDPEQVNMSNQLEHKFQEEEFRNTGTIATALKDTEQLPPTAPPPLNMPIVATKKFCSSSG